MSDVILAAKTPAAISVHNVLAAAVTALHPAERTGHVIVQLAVGDEHVLAEVTRDAIARLGLTEGRRVQALIKSVSLEVVATHG